MDWTDPGPQEVAPGVHRIPLPLPLDGLRAVNVYAILGDGPHTLIDGGWRIEIARTALDDALADLGTAVEQVGRCLVTHHHRDHYTQALDLRRRAGVSVALGEGERPNLEAVASLRTAFAAQRRTLVAAGADVVIAGLEALPEDAIDPQDYEDPDVWLKDHDVVELNPRRLRVRATPGHTRGHVVYLDDTAGLIFAGDHILPHITPSIGFEAAVDSAPLADYLSSLALTLSEPDRTLLPAHGPAGGSAHLRAQELLAHHETRLVQTRDAVLAGAGTGYEVAAALRWTRRGRRLSELDVFNQLLAVSETVAHLQVLGALDRVRVRTGDGAWDYSIAAG